MCFDVLIIWHYHFKAQMVSLGSLFHLAHECLDRILVVFDYLLLSSSTMFSGLIPKISLYPRNKTLWYLVESKISRLKSGC